MSSVPCAEIIKNPEIDLSPIRERLKKAFEGIFRKTDGKLNPRDSYGKLVISTFNAFRKCEQRAKLAKIDTEASEQRAERAILLWQFKREDDIKAAEDAKKKAKRE